MCCCAQKKRKYKQNMQNGFVALKYVNDRNSVITPAQSLKTSLRHKCSICEKKGAHLHCHTCPASFHLSCAGADPKVAVCREAYDPRDASQV